MAINKSLKIIFTFCLIASLFVSIYHPKNILELDLTPVNHINDHSFVVFNQSNEYFANINNSQKGIDSRPQKIMTLGKLHTQSCLNHFEFLILKKYNLQNELIFNLPFICYKFPLSEHTEEG